MKDMIVTSTAWRWVASVVYQGERVLDLQERMKMPRDLDELSKQVEHLKKNPDMSPIEDHYFVTSVSKSVEWIAEIHKLDLIDPTLTEAFLNEASEVKTVRNVREHYNEYLDGREKSKNKVIIEVEDLTVRIDATSVAIDSNGVRIIGGRVRVQPLMEAAKALLPALYQAKEAAVQADLALQQARLSGQG
ncbi:hypothetical protein [Pseudomonas sp. NPDC096925]|uniref:hypothetical protein n=1 Tax=Pseudomonas sp. NPDC096925 TaxID=3364484 RepID=UPI003839D84B